MTNPVGHTVLGSCMGRRFWHELLGFNPSLSILLSAKPDRGSRRV